MNTVINQKRKRPGKLRGKPHVEFEMGKSPKGKSKKKTKKGGSY